MGNIIRGGQTLAHAVAMGWQNVRLLMLIGIASFGICFCGCVWYHTPPVLKPWIAPWGKARVLATLSPTYTTTIPVHEKLKRVSSGLALTHPMIKAVHHEITFCLRFAMVGSLSTMVFMVLWFSVRGYRQRRDILLSGTYLASQNHLQKKIGSRGKVGDYHLAGVQLQDGDWHQHVLVHGSTGTGKSLVLRQLCDQIRARGDKAIIYDNHQGFMPYYYRDGKDVLLNPLDKRCAAWDLWQECKEEAQFDSLAHSLIPRGLTHSDPFWVDAARTVFVAMAKVLQQEAPEKRMTEFADRLLMGSIPELYQWLQHTEARSLVSPEAEKMALSIQGVLASTIRAWRLLRNPDKPPFAIGDWLKDNNDGWLFITGREDMADTLRPLLSMWLDGLANRLLSLSSRTNRRIFIVIDELASLQRLPSLLRLLAQSRKFGGCVVLSTQNIFQLRDLYGQEGTKAITDLCNTRLFFRSPSEEAAQFVSRELGQGFWLEAEEGMSYGASRFRDGVTLQRRRVSRPAVKPDVIQHLPDRHSILQVSPMSSWWRGVPKRWPVAQVIVPWGEKTPSAPGFIPVEHAIPFLTHHTASSVTEPGRGEASQPSSKKRAKKINTDKSRESKDGL